MNANLKEAGGERVTAPDAGLAGLALAQWPGDVALLRPDLSVEWINERFATRLGLPGAACVGLGWLALHPTAAVHAAEYRRATRGEAIELPAFPAQGPERLGFFVATLQPILRDGEVAGLLVTERDVSLAALDAQLVQRRQSLLRAMSEASRDAVVLLDASGAMTFVGDAVLQVTGRPPHEYLGHSIFQFVHPDDLAEVRAKIASGEVLRTPLRMRRVRYRFLHADGQWRWFESLAVNALHDPLLESIIVHSRDVSGDVALEEALRRRERRFRTLTEKSDDLVVVLGADGSAVFESASVGRIFGFRPRELTAQRILRLIHPGHRRQVLAAGRALVAAHGQERRLEFMIRDATGGYRWIEATLVDLIEDPDVNGLLVNARDVTSRKIAEAERDGALQDAAVFLWEKDVATRRMRWRSDSVSLQRLGVPAAEHGEDEWLARVHPDDAARVRTAHLGLATGSSRTLNVEYRVRDFEGQWKRVLLRGQPAGPDLRSGGRLVRGVCIDVTERRRIEDALARSREQFRLALECAQIGFYEWDVVADTLTGLDDWCAARGVPPERGRPGHDARWESLVHPDDLDGLRRSFAEHFRGESEFAEIEYRMRSGDGRWIWVFDRSQITERTPDGRPQRVSGVCMEIGRSKEAERALRKSEFLYRTVAEFTPGFVCELSIDPSGAMRVVWASEGFAQVYGVGPEQFHRLGLQGFFEPADIEMGRALIRRLCRGEQVSEQVRVRNVTGSHRWIHLTLRPFFDLTTGTAHAAIGLAHDITERKLAEDALRESQLRLRAIAENSTDWLLLVDREHRIVFVNRPIGAIQPEQVAGRPVMEFTPAHDREGSREFISAALAGLDPQPQREQVLEDAAAGPRVLLMRAQPVRAGEAIVAVVLTITEITRQRRDERMLRLQSRILETMREGVVLVDSRNEVRLTNPAFDELFGYGPGELVGRSIEQLFRLDSAALRGADRRLRAQLAAARPEPMELECLRRDGGSFAAACVVTPLAIDGEEHWLAVLNDVTERKLLEREILEVSNREQQRIGSDLHDGLGQELTGVALMLRGLATRIRREHPEALGEVDEIVGLLNQSIHNARTLARGLSPVSLERGGLVPALRTLAARARETYGLATSLRTRLSQPLRVDEGAASHLYRIVQEALSNAMRHGRATRVRIQLTADDVAIRLSVHDNGRGLPPDGQRAPGLGLRTMRYRAQVVGGDLLVANHRLGGTIVRCVCPQGAREHVSPLDARAPARSNAALPGVRGGTIPRG